MKRFRVIASLTLGLAFLFVGSQARADNDCCAQQGGTTCFEAASEAACFAHAGLQKFAVDYDCVTDGDTTCTLKTGGSCDIGGDCDDFDTVEQPEIPTLSEWGLVAFGMVLLGAMAFAVQRRAQSFS